MPLFLSVTAKYESENKWNIWKNKSKQKEKKYLRQ
jgi:hypothetical protein